MSLINQKAFIKEFKLLCKKYHVYDVICAVKTIDGPARFTTMAIIKGSLISNDLLVNLIQAELFEKRYGQTL